MLLSEELRVGRASEILISELHSEYVGIRNLAMAQLILLGEKARQPLFAFLKKESDILDEMDEVIMKVSERESEHQSLQKKQSTYAGSPLHDRALETSRELRKMEIDMKDNQRLLCEEFRKKRGFEPWSYYSKDRISILESVSKIFRDIDDPSSKELTENLLQRCKKYTREYVNQLNSS
jgi:hypothetical protein